MRPRRDPGVVGCEINVGVTSHDHRLDVFDTTLKETNLWLKELMERLGTYDRHHAYSTLRAVARCCTPYATASGRRTGRT